MASFPPVDSESSGSNAPFNYRDIFKSASDGYILSRSSSEASSSVNLRDIFKSASNSYSLSRSSSDASCSVNLRDIFKMSSNRDENGRGENSSEENGNDEEDNEEDDSDEEDSDEEDSDDDDDSFTSCDEVKLRIPTAEDVDNLPFRVTTCGPPQVDTKLHTDIMAFRFSPVRCFWDPVWIIQPDIDIITDMIRPYARLCGLPNEDISVEFLSKGSWNSVYVVSSADKSSQCIFRCALPGNPWFRMQLEVSTMEYVRMHTAIPVPKVFAFNSSMKNPLGLEWMLMEKVNGITYAEALKNNTITFDAEVQLHRTVADWVHQLSQLTFSQMGSIYRRWDRPITDLDAFVLGPLNDWDYIVDIRPDLHTYRGPFASKADYIASILALRTAESGHPRIKQRADYFAAHDAAAEEALPPDADPSTVPIIPPTDDALERAADGDYTHDTIQHVPTYAAALQSLLPLCAAATAPFAAAANNNTHLHHDDMHERNIIVDGEGKPVALLDWESAHACPRAWTQRYPPVIDDGVYPNPADIDAVRAKYGRRPMDSEEKAAAERDWRSMLLRGVYEERMRELGVPVRPESEGVGDIWDEERILERILDRARRIDRFYDDWEFIREVKDRQLEKLLGVTKSKV